MKTSLLITFLLISVQVYAQEAQKKFSIRLGVGKSLLGTGDIITTTFENELNYQLSPYFTTALSLNYGRSSHDAYHIAAYTQGNLNIYLSPFKNTRRNDFRLGAGLSVYKITDAFLQSRHYSPYGGYFEALYSRDTRDAFGYSFIVEDTYTIKSKYLIGLKLFTQPYYNGDINSGLLLKSGVKF